jgi:hypothetical protein
MKHIDFTMDDWDVTASGYLDHKGEVNEVELTVHNIELPDDNTYECLREHALYLLQEELYNPEVRF